MRGLFILFLLLTKITVSYAQHTPFDPDAQPLGPDYSLEKNWAALPFRNDAADVIPSSEQWLNDSLKEADVFFIYPTVYMKGKTWNADLDNKKLNKKIDKKPIRYQASVFNASCRVYAPRYRQACLQAFYDGANGDKALAFAYEDVKRAFQYYLEHYNNGRPIIIASHSQGSRHAKKLLQEFFDTSALRSRLVAAYMIGFGINQNMYANLKPCENPKQTDCYVTWASFQKGFEPGESPLYGNICVNPLSWNRDTITIDASQSMGALFLSFNKKYDHACSVQVHKSFLWVKTDLPIIRRWKNLHIADYNLYWFDIRQNVRDRVIAFERK